MVDPFSAQSTKSEQYTIFPNSRINRKTHHAMSWSNLSSRQSSYDEASAVVLRGTPIATLPRIPRNDGMPQIMSGIASVSRAIGEATGFKRVAETDTNNYGEKDGSLLSADMKAHIL
jgi:hypothetical protein